MLLHFVLFLAKSVLLRFMLFCRDSRTFAWSQKLCRGEKITNIRYAHLLTSESKDRTPGLPESDKKPKAKPFHPNFTFSARHKYDNAIYVIMMQSVAFAPCQYIDKRICTLSSRHKFYPGIISTIAMTDLYPLLGPPGAQKGPDTRLKCVVTMCPTQAGHSGAVGTKSGPPGLPEDLRGPQKGHFGPF